MEHLLACVWEICRIGCGTGKAQRIWFCLFFVLLQLSLYEPPLYGQRKPYELPKEPLEFAAYDPTRPNAFDLLVTVNGHIFLRYQRATNSNFSFIFDLNGYMNILNLFHLFAIQQYTAGTLSQDIRLGAGIGLAFWPWEKLRKGYIALRSQMQLQLLNVEIDNSTFSPNRFLVANSLEIGTRLGKRVLSAGAFGGIGFQVTTDERTTLPQGFSIPIIYAYLGFGVGFTFR